MFMELFVQKYSEEKEDFRFKIIFRLFGRMLGDLPNIRPQNEYSEISELRIFVFVRKGNFYISFDH